MTITEAPPNAALEFPPLADVGRWREALKDAAELRMHSVLVGILMADHWEAESESPLCVSVETLIRQSRLSRSGVYRALSGLNAAGYIVQVVAPRRWEPPRWRPILPTQAEWARAVIKSRLDSNPGTIYYVRIGEHVKVGYTMDLSNRMNSYPPDAIVLASHPGTLEDEAALHEELKPYLAARREWYRSDPELLARIAHLPRVQEAQMPDPWATSA